MDRALLQAPAAADTAERPLVIVGMVDQLVHKALTEALELRQRGWPADILVNSEYMQESQQRKRLTPWPVLKSLMS